MIPIINAQEFAQKKTLTNDSLPDIQSISDNIKQNKDEALKAYTQQFDNASLTTLIVTQQERDSAHQLVQKELIQALQNAKKNIEAFHKHQYPKNWLEETPDGSKLGMRYTPIDRVGLYVPGGRAVYPSTVLMNAIPAKIAGVPTTVMATPPRPDGTIHPALLVAADLCDVDIIIKCGGAQAVFALAYGTQTIPKVDKIVGPGNKYVTAAKQAVYGQVDIDKPAGPSEVLVYIETPDHAPAAAAELLAQLEHDPDASAVAISTSNETLIAIQTELAKQLPTCLRKAIIQESLKNSTLILAASTDDAIQIINTIASEHLVLLLDNYHPILEKVRHAGAVFCGRYSPVTIGDYYAGTNHVLPTAAAARFSSPLGVLDFMKSMSVVDYSKAALKAADADLLCLTQTEGFDAHYNAVKVRLS